MNWFLKMIGMQSVVDEVQARADRQVEALQDEIDILEGRINLTKGELLGQIGSLRGQMATLLDHITNPIPNSGSEGDSEYRRMVSDLLASLDEDLRSIHTRLATLEEADATDDAVNVRLEGEIDDNVVEIYRIKEDLSGLTESVSQLSYDFQIHLGDYRDLVSTYNSHVRKNGLPHTTSNTRPLIHDTFE